MVKKILWTLVIISLIASVPLMVDRYNGETSTKRVEVVADYDKMMRLSMRSTTDVTPIEMLEHLALAGVNSVAVYEVMVRDLVDQGMIQLYTTNHLNLFSEGDLPSNRTLALFSTHLTEDEITVYQELFLGALPEITEKYLWQGKPAILINKPAQVIENTVLGFDFQQINELNELGFHVVARVRTTRDWNEAWLAYQFETLEKLGVKTIIFDGKDVLGYPSTEKIEQVAEWLNRHHLNFAVVEFHEQTGDQHLSALTNHRIVRLLSVSEQMMEQDSASTITNMLSLGITERNVRMVYVNLPAPLPQQPQADSDTVLEKANEAIHATVQNIRQQEYELGHAIPFSSLVVYGTGWQRILVFLGALALMSLLAYRIRPGLAFLPIPLGLLIYGAGQMTDRMLAVSQGFALLTAIAAPTLATILIIEYIEKRRERLSTSPVLWSVGLFIATSLISLYGAVVVTALLNHLVFIKYMEQFRGVKSLYVGPILVLGLYFLLRNRLIDLYDQGRSLLQKSIQVKHLSLTGLILLGIYYYISRSGNEGVVIPFELELRQLLNELFGVRPRNKEIFFSHPLFIFATYILIRYKKGSLLFLIGIIGQMSMVSTFTHLHTPLLISLERTAYGMLGGMVIGLFLILVWNLAVILWNKRERLLNNAKR